MKDLIKMVVVLTVICLASAFSLTALNNGLKERIAQQEEVFVLGPAVHAIFPSAPNDPVADAFTVDVDGQPWRLFPLIENGTVKAVALVASGAGGYGGDVNVMVGVDFTGDEILGVRVTKHGETPGVGTRAADPSYLKVYAGLPIHPGMTIALKSAGGQIEGVSGATRTSTAIADAVNKAVAFVLAHKAEIPQWARGADQGQA